MTDELMQTKFPVPSVYTKQKLIMANVRENWKKVIAGLTKLQMVDPYKLLHKI